MNGLPDKTRSAKPLLVFLAVLGGLVVILNKDNVTTIAPSDTGHWVPPPQTPRDLRDEAMAQTTISAFTWSTDGMIMTANFTIKNDGPKDIKDVEIKCRHSAASGTVIDSNTRTIYDIVKSHSTKRFRNFNMGFIHSQAASSGCAITDVALVP